MGPGRPALCVDGAGLSSEPARLQRFFVSWGARGRHPARRAFREVEARATRPVGPRAAAKLARAPGHGRLSETGLRRPRSARRQPQARGQAHRARPARGRAFPLTLETFPS